MKRLVCLTAVTVAVAGLSAVADEADAPEEQKLIARARVLGPDTPPPSEDMEDGDDDDEAQPATGGVPPQYRSRRYHQSQYSVDQTGVRFVLPLAVRPILVEALITVDGKPFRTKREQRIDQILATLAEPPEPAPESVDSEVDKPSEPVASDSETSKDAPPAESESDDPDDEAENAGADTEPETDNEPPPPDNSIPGRLRRYAAATGRSPSREEVRWLLQNWVDGPVLLILNDNFQRIRARQTPVFRVLDRDEDGVLSEVEIAQADASLMRYDRNQDDVLSYDEVSVGANRTPEVDDFTPSSAPMILLDDLANPRTWRLLAGTYVGPEGGNSDAVSEFDLDSSGDLSAEELAWQSARRPDLTLVVTFNTETPEQSRIEVPGSAESLGEVTATARESSITLAVAGSLVEFSTAQRRDEADADQISVGAVRDGYPLLPALDFNDDGRLTLRELRQTVAQVASFDRNEDLRIARAEIPSTLRVSIGFGATVHQHLATVRAVHSPAPGSKVSPPDWFVRIDVNKDGDLTIKEFLGTREQFAEFDKDMDGLLSVAEAVAKEEETEVADEVEKKTEPTSPPVDDPTSDE